MNEIPVKLTDFEAYNHFCAFVFLREKEANQELEKHEQDRYEILAIHPDKSNEHYHMLVTYVMPLDNLIEFLKLTQYQIISIRKLRKQKGSK